MHLLPETPRSFFTSNLLSIYGRLRIVYEMFVPGKEGNDETLADFARRRLGKEATVARPGAAHRLPASATIGIST